MGWDEYALLREAVDNNKDGGVSAGEREVLNEVHGDGVPWSLWHRKLLEESIGTMMQSFGTSAGSTGADKLLHKISELWPGVFTSD